MQVWDAEGGRETARTKVTGFVRSAVFSVNGRNLLVLSDELHVLEAASAKEIARVGVGYNRGFTLSFDRRHVLMGNRSNDNTVAVLDVNTGGVVELVGHKEYVREGSFSLDGQQVLTTSNDGTARVWDVKSGKEIARLQGHDDVVWSAAFSPDGRRVATGSRDGTARIWDITPRPPPLLTFVTLDYDQHVRTAAFSADGRLVVTTSLDDNTARAWDAETGKQVVEFLKKGEDKILDAAFGSEGRRRVVTHGANIARVWDFESGKEIAQLQHEGDINRASFSPDGRLVVTTSSDRTARVWDAESGKEIARLPGITWPLAISADGRRVVGESDDTTVLVWDVESGSKIASFRASKLSKDVISTLMAVALSPDGRRVLAVFGLDYSTVIVWDIESGNETARLPVQSFVESATFSPDGLRVLTGTAENTVRMWDLESGKEVDRIQGKGQRDEVFIGLVALSQDGRRLFIKSRKTARVGSIFTNTQSLVDYAKIVVLRCLTHSQRAEFFLDQEAPDWCNEMAKWPYSPRRFGISVTPANDETARVVVSRVVRGLPAEAAGLAIDDIIVSVDGVQIEGAQAFSAALDAVKPDKTARVTIVRQGTTLELTLKPRF